MYQKINKAIGLSFVLSLLLAMQACSKDDDKFSIDSSYDSYFTPGNAKSTSNAIEEPVKLSSALRVDTLSEGLHNINNLYPHIKNPTRINEKVKLKVSKKKGLRGKYGKYYRPPSPLIINNNIYSSTPKGYIVKLDSNLKLVWENRLDKDSRSSGVLSTAVSGDFIYISTYNGYVYKISTEDGQTAWKRRVSDNIIRGPVIYNDYIFIADFQNTLYAINIEDSRVAWTKSYGPADVVIKRPSSFAIYKNNIIYATSTGNIVAVNANNGSEVWSRALNKGDRIGSSVMEITDITSAPVVYKGDIIVSAMGKPLVSLDAKTGKKNWSNQSESRVTPTISGNTIFTIDNNNSLNAIDANTGASKFIVDLNEIIKTNRKAPDSEIWLRPILINYNIFVVNNNGNALILNSKDGSLVRKLKITKDLISNPAVTSDVIGMIKRNGSVYMYKLKNNE